MKNTKQKIAVVGAGVGGLATAARLASRGFEVDVYEKLPRVGGRTSSLEAQGFRFDFGPTFFLYPQILSEIFSTAGYDLYDEVDKLSEELLSATEDELNEILPEAFAVVKDTCRRMLGREWEAGGQTVNVVPSPLNATECSCTPTAA